MSELTRRSFLRAAAVYGSAAAAGWACAPAPGTVAPSASATAAATAKPLTSKGAWVALTSNQLLWPLATEAGYFKKYNLDFDLSYIAGSNNAVASMISGEIGLTSVAGSAVVTAQAGGADIVMIAGFVNKMIFRVLAGPSITSIAQLKGKTIAVTRIGTADYFAWQTIIAKQGWKPTDVDFVAASDPPGQVAALMSGKVAAIAVSPPNNVIATKAGAHEILDMASYNEPEQNVGVAVMRKFLTDSRPVALAVMKASIEAIARWKKDPAFVKDVIKKYLRNDDAEFLEVGYTAYRDVFPQAPYPSEQALQKVIEETATQTPKARDLKVASLIDRSIVAELESSGFIKQVFG